MTGNKELFGVKCSALGFHAKVLDTDVWPLQGENLATANEAQTFCWYLLFEMREGSYKVNV